MIRKKRTLKRGRPVGPSASSFPTYRKAVRYIKLHTPTRLAAKALGVSLSVYCEWYTYYWSNEEDDLPAEIAQEVSRRDARKLRELLALFNRLKKPVKNKFLFLVSQSVAE